MQTGYENVQGWLGIIMNDKIYINFSRYELEECFRRLKHELDAYFNTKAESKQCLAKTNVEPLCVGSPKNEELTENWSEDNVRSWFIENQLNLNIFEKMRPFDGACLKELFLVKKNASQFYYQSLQDIQGVKLNNIVLFSSLLDKLFSQMT